MFNRSDRVAYNWIPCQAIGEISWNIHRLFLPDGSFYQLLAHLSG